MASGGITGEPVQTARLGSYMSSTGGGARRNVTQKSTSGGGSSTQRKSTSNLNQAKAERQLNNCLLYTSPSPRDLSTSRMPSSA